MKYYSAVKRNKVMIHVTAWMKFANSMLSERSWTPMATYCKVLFIGNIENRQIHSDKKQISGCHELRRGRNGKCISLLGLP